MSDDLTQRLRDSAEQWLTEVDTRLEAADRIEQLEAALKEIQRHAEMMRVWAGMEWRYHPIHAQRIFDRASAALGATSERIADESERDGCTEPNRPACPRRCLEFCNQSEQEKALSQFTEYFVKNYPGPYTIIHDPRWHAPKIFCAAERAIRGQQSDDAKDAERYRWLRDECDSSYVGLPYVVKREYIGGKYIRFAFEPAELDAAIDAAIAAQPQAEIKDKP